MPETQDLDQSQNVQQNEVTAHLKQHKIIYTVFAVFIVILLLIVIRDRGTDTVDKSTSPNQITPTVAHLERSNRIEGQISLKFKPGVSRLQISQNLHQFNAKIIKTIPQINWVIIQIPEAETDTILDRLSRDGLIEESEPVYKIHSTAVPNDPQYPKQYHLKNTGQTVKEVTGNPGADINIEQAWDVTMGNGIKVAVIDSGINLTHEDLQNKVIAQRSFIEGDTSVEDEAGHGTVDAGILAANANNGLGVAGICPGCQLIIARSTDENAAGTTASTAEGIMWSADQGAQVINMSLGGEDQSQLLQEAVNYAIQKGSVLVGAAGNCADNDFRNNNCTTQNPKFYPAASEGVIAVTATDNTDKRYVKANFGNWIHIAAPGNGIFATVPNHPYTQGTTLNYSMYDGTSQAAPQVSGVLALLLAKGLSREAAIQQMYATAEKIQGTGTDWVHGRLNAGKALTLAAPSPAVSQPVVVPSQSVQPSTTQPDPSGILPTAPVNPSPQSTMPLQPNPTCIYNALGGIPCLPSSEPPDESGQPEKSGPTLPPENNSSNEGIVQLILLLLLSFLKFVFGGFGD